MAELVSCLATTCSEWIDAGPKAHDLQHSFGFFTECTKWCKSKTCKLIDNSSKTTSKTLRSTIVRIGAV